jgi:ankyrin repeat protein
VRWSLTYGGQTPGTRDDDGFTAIHLAAATNKHKVLQLMLDICRRSRELELIDLRDGEVCPSWADHRSALGRESPPADASAGRATR